jgi:peptidoglycan/LPS O-acetylase OafA/YrhL
VLLVMANHARLPGFASGGDVGVTMFFVLSGFLITSLLAEERLDTGRIQLRAFYLRRMYRLLPALIVLMVGMCIVAAAGSVRGSGTSLSTLPRSLLAAGFFVANWFRVAGYDLGHFDHTWSLAIEEQFYLLWPAALVVLVPALLRRRRLVLAGVAVVGLASVLERFALHASGASYARTYFGTDTRADALLFGAVLALAFVGRHVPARPLIFLAAGSVGIAIACVLRGSGTWTPTVAAVASVAVMTRLGSQLPHTSILEWGPLAATGRVSYGLYLWHVPIFAELLPHLPATGAGVPRALGLFALAFGVAAASYFLVERPFLRRKQRLSRVADPPEGVTSAPGPG